MKPWILLIVAGMLESGWAVGLKHTDAFTRFWPSVCTLLALAASMILLALSVRELPIGTAYPIWVGIGAIGAACFGMLYLGEPASPARILCLFLMVGAIIGLKVTSAESRGGKTEIHLNQMINCDLETSVPDWVIEYPETLIIFQKLGIDYSCGGKSLRYACHAQGLDGDSVMLDLLRHLDVSIQEASDSNAADQDT